MRVPRKSKPLLAGVAVVAAGLILAGCASSPEATEDRILRLAHGFDLAHPMHTCLAGYFADRVNEEVDGLKIEVLASGTAGSETEMLDQLNVGALDFVAGGPSEAQRYYAPLGVFNAAYAFDDADHLYRIWDGEVGEDMQQGLLDASNIYMLELAVSGYRHFTSNSPLRTPEDFAGVRLRAPDVPIYIANAEVMGAIPTPVDFAELYLALQQGIVDAQENPVPTIESLSLSEVQEYLNLSAHALSVRQLSVNKDIFDSFTPEQQEAVLAIARDAREETDKCATSDDETIAQWRDEGTFTVIDDVDRAAFAELAAEQLPGRFPEWDGLYERIRADSETDAG